MTSVNLIVCIGPNNVIGIRDKLLWKSKQDFYHFKKMTMHNPCIFGAKTFYGLPKYPLKDRLCIVLDDSIKYDYLINQNDNGSYIVVKSICRALEMCKSFSNVYVCGGAGVYKSFLDAGLIDNMYVTRIISKKIESTIASSNKEELIYFPYDINEYTKEGWEKERIKYSEEELSEEYDDITVLFRKYKKIK